MFRVFMLLSTMLCLAILGCKKRTDLKTASAYKIQGTLVDSCDGNPIEDAQVFITLYRTVKFQGKDSILQETIQCKTQKAGYFSVNFNYLPNKCVINGFYNKKSRFLVSGPVTENHFLNGVFSLNQIYFYGISVTSNLRFICDSSFKSGDIIILYDLNPPYEDHRDTIRGKPGKFWNYQTKLWYKWNYLEKDPVTQNWILNTPYYFKRIRGNDTLMFGEILNKSSCQSSLTDTLEVLIL